ncbi:TetR/AcrR family transcriptional regulator [Tropicimonas sediminicola]|uniref:Transcriptional regulator, TetR family n=1 Tax=Tropicimonas sediminicola TaxID=1031541 RepID=A0A239LQZ9_9RHOB|nr:TetR/AcrR family transcriptional regulator [Tropicimonas sediminicola]SNT32298.1 transcriptional regulator, TetR family [Tropicimonas sediminicola]
MQATGETTRPRGRPRNVPKDRALDAAVRLFWASGYDAASIDQLCRETGMPRASLYQDYGGKQGLFLAAIAHYVDTRLRPIGQALGPAGSLEDDLARFFEAVVALATRDSQTPGCLISCVLAEVAGANETFRQELDSRFTALENRIHERLSHGADAPDNARALAGMLAAVARGMMLRARAGATAVDLEAIAEVTLATLCSERSLCR